MSLKKMRLNTMFTTAIMLFPFHAIAQEATSISPEAPSPIPMLIIVFAIFYFLMIRPQNKKLKKHRQMIEEIKRGDKVITAGGIEGKIVKIEKDSGFVEVEIAPDVKVKILRSTITDVKNKNSKNTLEHTNKNAANDSLKSIGKTGKKRKKI